MFHQFSVSVWSSEQRKIVMVVPICHCRPIWLIQQEQLKHHCPTQKAWEEPI